MDNVVKNLDNINRTLEKQNEIIQKLLDVIPKPENKFTRVLETIVLIAGVLGILNAADIIRNWIIGGGK
jgi:hypothetical protein